MSGAPLELLLDDEELELELLLLEELELLLLDEELELEELLLLEELELLLDEELELEELLDELLELDAAHIAVAFPHFVQIPVLHPVAGIDKVGQSQSESAEEVPTPGVPVNVTPGISGVQSATY